MIHNLIKPFSYQNKINIHDTFVGGQAVIEDRYIFYNECKLYKLNFIRNECNVWINLYKSKNHMMRQWNVYDWSYKNSP